MWKIDDFCKYFLDIFFNFSFYSEVFIYIFCLILIQKGQAVPNRNYLTKTTIDFA